MNILITGANGFLGSNLTEKLLKENHCIYALSVNDYNLKRFNNLKFDSTKLENITSLKQNILAFKPEVIIHCAWNGGNAHRDINSIKQFDNVAHSLDLLKILTELDDLYFICMGSMSEYGIKNYKTNEETIETPNSLYGISKYALKMYSEQICRENNFKWLWIRPSYVYGANDVKTRLIPKTIINCLKNEDLTLNSCDSCVDYIYIEDFINGVYRLIENKSQGVYNICSSKEYGVKDIVETIHKLSNSSSSILFDSSLDRKNFSNYICGDNNKIYHEINWTPKIKINEGLSKTINFLRGEKNVRQ